MNGNERNLRRALRDWDPAARIAGPDPAAVASMRAGLLEKARRRPTLLPLLAVASLAAASLILLFVLPTETTTVAEADSGPVTVQFTASNGVRIHWSVYPEAAAGKGRPLQQRGTP